MPGAGVVGAGVCAHADEAARKVEAITAVSLLMDLSPVEVPRAYGLLNC